MDENNIARSGTVSMYNTRGSLKYVQAGMVPELKAQGWHIVVNPKRNYAPELDVENKNNFNPAPAEEDIDQVNILKFEDI